MGDLVNKWLKDISTVEQIKDAVVLEQFLNCLSSPIRVWIKIRKPKSCLEAGQLADNYTEARKQVKEEKYSGESNQKGKQIVTLLMLPGKTTMIHCVHGDNVLYPVARLNLEVEGVPVAVEAAVAKNLPTSVLLGTDVPELGRLLGLKPRSRWNKTQRALLAVSRAGARRQAKEEEERRQKEADCQVTSSPVTLDAQSTDEVAAATKGKEAPERHQVGEIKGNDGFVFNLSDDLFSGGKSRVKLSRSQKRAQIRMHQPAAEQLSSGPLDMSAEELKQLVKLDPSLSNLKVTGNKEDKTNYFPDKGLLYRRWIPKDRGQLVLPFQCRKAVLQLAHEVPIAGHLGKQKTSRRIMQRFYWPSLYRDVADFCKCCQICQKVSRNKAVHAPLIPLPVVTEPFRRVVRFVKPKRTRSAGTIVMHDSESSRWGTWSWCYFQPQRGP